MRLQGVNANIMSLGGIAIAIGAMVDAAIVMIEAMHRKMERASLTRENRWKDVGMTQPVEVGPALFFSLRSSRSASCPSSCWRRRKAACSSRWPFTKTYAMAAAAILSITLVPVLMGYFIRGRIVAERQQPAEPHLPMALYRPFLDARWHGPGPQRLLAVALVASM